MLNIIRKSIAASILIGLGTLAFLKLGGLTGAVLFSFGLLSVCLLNLNLYTGKIGFWFEEKIRSLKLLLILLTNILSGYLFGVLLRYSNPEIIEAAESKINSLSISPEFILQGILCGMIMYLAVKMFKKGTSLGILLGVPLFIMTGMQHCIANAITGGVALEYSPMFWGILGVNILSNTLGSISLSFLLKESKKKRISKNGSKL